MAGRYGYIPLALSPTGFVVAIDTPVVIATGAESAYFTVTFDGSTALQRFTSTNDSMFTYIGDQSGWFVIYCGQSFTHATNNTLAHFSFFENDIENEFVEAERKISTGGDFGSASWGYLVYLEKGDVLKVKFKADKAGNLTINHGQFICFRIW